MVAAMLRPLNVLQLAKNRSIGRSAQDQSDSAARMQQLRMQTNSPISWTGYNRIDPDLGAPAPSPLVRRGTLKMPVQAGRVLIPEPLFSRTPSATGGANDAKVDARQGPEFSSSVHFPGLPTLSPLSLSSLSNSMVLVVAQERTQRKRLPVVSVQVKGAESIEIKALLDTGATHDCILSEKARELVLFAQQWVG